MAKHENKLSFDKKETEALRQIVADWINEEIAVPPYPDDITAVLKKLDLAAPDRAGMTPPAMDR